MAPRGTFYLALKSQDVKIRHNFYLAVGYRGLLYLGDRRIHLGRSKVQINTYFSRFSRGINLNSSSLTVHREPLRMSAEPYS